VERAKPRLHGLRCIQEQKEGKLLLQDGALLFKPKYAKKYARTLSQSQILSDEPGGKFRIGIGVDKGMVFLPLAGQVDGESSSQNTQRNMPAR